MIDTDCERSDLIAEVERLRKQLEALSAIKSLILKELIE